ncbi:MAG TPA: threonine--tRNA ligase [Candidatus Acidoferrales bacterium]|jgi:threonyl-tRNA synthetase|nr:threonine--tRNA ligase [Candidatus Acidoferrales bacterium]
MDMIHITMPDGAIREVPLGTTAAEIAQQISPRLAKDALVARIAPILGAAGAAASSAVNAADEKSPDAAPEARVSAPPNGEGFLVDLRAPIDQDVRLSILTPKDPEAIQVLRHSAAHLLAAAVLELFPNVKLGIGPPIDTGFFYDFVREEPFTSEDLERIEKKMRELAAQDIPNERKMLPKLEALELYRKWDQGFKCELVEERATEPMVSFYTTGNFIDFCRGPHIPSTGRIRAFRLMSVAGAYWKGQEANPQMQRIYGACFYTQQELDEYLHRLEEAKRRDHRRLGQELELFSVQEEAGPGLIFWHPKGGLIRKVMEDWLRDELLRRGYDLVYTPHIMRLELWKTSGHANFYRENMFGPVEVEKDDYQLKPMNCPGHILIYKSRLRSYRELPVRLAELGTVYRYERSGVLHGLLRVRGFTQDDAHIFCMPEQIESEIEACIDFAFAVMKTFGFSQYVVELSDWDAKHPENYPGSAEDWARSTGALDRTLTRLGIPFKRMEGEGAFYGPKIDFKLIDAIGRPWQLTTVQFDFNLPGRFGLEYVGEDGNRHQPLMVHRALWGSVERFFGILIEHYAGAFPVWLAPVQAEVLPLSEKFVEYAKKVSAALKDAGFRAHLDDRNEKLQAKIRDAQLLKIPYMLIVGGKEAEAGTVSVRHQSKGDLGPRPLADFLSDLRQQVDSRAI